MQEGKEGGEKCKGNSAIIDLLRIIDIIWCLFYNYSFIICMIKYYNNYINHFCQWIVVFGIFTDKYIELGLLLVSILIYYSSTKIIFQSKLLPFLALIVGFSLLTVSFVGYSYAKTIQQIIIVSLFLLLYEQFFCFNCLYLIELFRKYILATYYICIFGIFQESIYLLTHFNILDVLPFYHSNHYALDGFLLRISSTMSEGGWLGIALVPSLLYLFWYNDCLNILGKKRWIVLLVSVLTFSPFVFIVFILLIVRILTSLSYKIRKVIVVFCVCVIGFGVYQIINTNNYEQFGVFSGIFQRLSLSYAIFSNINNDDLGYILSYSNNASVNVLAKNAFVAIHAPSRLIGTGIGTNAQSYAKVVNIEEHLALNVDDAYSLGIRIFSEFGILGIILYVFFVCKHFNRYNMMNVCFSGMIICLFLRGGSYILYGIIFIHYFFYYTSKFKTICYERYHCV